MRWRHGLLRVLAAAAGAAFVVLTARNVGLGHRALGLGALGSALLFLPVGYLLTARLRGALLTGERVVLAALVGYPSSAVLYYALALTQAYALFIPLLATLTVLAGVGLAQEWRTARSSSRADPGTTPWKARAQPHISLLVLVPALLFLTTRGAAAFQRSGASLIYDHCVDASWHLATYWELLRGVPPLELPTAAGLPFPQYHLLSFMPGLFLAKQLGLDVSDVYHGVTLLWRISFLMGGLYLTARLLSRDGRVATATVAVVFALTQALEAALDMRFASAPTPFYFIRVSESGGGAVVVWTAVAALLALRADALTIHRRWALSLAALLAGLSFGFKAHIFLLMGSAFVGALAAAVVRRRQPDHLLALLLIGASAAALHFSWRGTGALGLPHFTPGLFAELYVYPALAKDPWGLVHNTLLEALRRLPRSTADVLATLIAGWRLISFSPLVPVWLVYRLRRWPTLTLGETFFLLACLGALPLAYGYSITSVGGVISPYDFIQTAQCLPFFGALVGTLILVRLAQRWTRDAGRAVLWGAITGSALLAPGLLLGRPLPTPYRSVEIRPDEQCALLYLRDQTPIDSVVAIARGDGVPPDSRRLNHHAIVAGLAGRRSIIEFYWDEVDPAIDRIRATRRLFGTPREDVAAELLRRFRVDYVVEYRARPLLFPKTGLEEVFARGGVRIYRVSASRSAEAAPQGIPQSSGLACHVAR